MEVEKPAEEAGEPRQHDEEESSEEPAIGQPSQTAEGEPPAQPTEIEIDV